MNRALNEGDVVYLLTGLAWTLGLTAIAFVGGGLLGLLVAVARTSGSRPLRWLAIGYIRLFQGVPVLIQLFIAFFVPGLFGVRVSPLVAAAIALSFNASAFLGEIWRGCIESVPKGQWEASASLGLRRLHQLRLVIIPQTFRAAIPPTVGYLVQLIKATSLASIVGFVELSRAGYNLVNSTFQPFTIYLMVAIGYFALCFPLARASVALERRLARTTNQ